MAGLRKMPPSLQFEDWNSLVDYLGGPTVEPQITTEKIVLVDTEDLLSSWQYSGDPTLIDGSKIYGGIGTVWGSITGVLSDQLDLKSALDGKAPVSHSHDADDITTGVLVLARGGTGKGAFSAGSIIFSDGSILTEDNANLFWNRVNKYAGFGTATPNRKVEIQQSGVAGENILLRLNSVNAGSTPGESIEFAESGTVVGKIYSQDDGAGNVSLRFHTYSGGLAERMRITGDGKVGIGISPTCLLDAVELAGNDAVLRLRCSGGANVSRISLDNASTGGKHWTISSWSSAYAGSFLIVNETDGKYYVIDTSLNFYPSTNKAANLGGASYRFNTLYQGTSTSAGTSRHVKSLKKCPIDNSDMIRGTGSLVSLDEDHDIVLCRCPTCDVAAWEVLKHLPDEKLNKIRDPPKIEFLGVHVFEFSGNSRQVRVDFKYKDEIRDKQGNMIQQAITNSTYLGESELEQFRGMQSADERRKFLLDLGQKEWVALERTRLMREHVAELQSELDLDIIELKGMNLLA